MAVQLNKIITEETITKHKNVVHVSFDILSGISASKVSNLRLTHNQLGGSFSVTLENYHTSYSFQEGDFVTAVRIGGNAYRGTVTKLKDSIGKQGITLTVEGDLKPINRKTYDNVSFSNATPFLRPDGSLVDPNIHPLIPNHYRLIGLDASMVVQRLSSRSGIPLATSLPFSYPIWSYEVIGSSVLEALNDLAKHACANAILRFESNLSTVRFVPFGKTVNKFEYDFSELENDFEPEIEETEFSDIILTPSSDITPWNSTYAGTPQSLGTITFSAGPSNASDFTTNTTQSSDDWQFPYAPGNVWVRYVGSAQTFKSKVGLAFGHTNLWASRPHVERVLNYSSFGTFGGASNFIQEPSYESLNVGNRNPDIVDYDMLYEWSLASKRFESQGDILPELIVVPGENVPEFNTTFNIPFDNQFTAQLLDYGLPKYAPNSSVPGPIGRITPSYFSCSVYRDEACSERGFAKDGSFYIGLRPNNVPIKQNTFFQPLTATDDTFTPLGAFGVDVYAPTVQYAIDTVKDRPAPFIHEGQVVSDAHEPILLIHYAKGNNASGINDERIEQLTALLNKMKADGYDAIQVNANTGTQNLTRKFQILNIDIVDTDTVPKIKIKTDRYPRLSVDNAPFSLAKMLRSVKGYVISEDAPSGVVYSSTKSGTLNEVATNIEGKWTLFKLPRVTYTPTCLCKVGIGQAPVFSYSGLLPYQPSNPKNISGGLFTDYWRDSTGHVYNFLRIFSSYLAQKFVSFSITVPYKGGKIPQPGDEITVKRIPKAIRGLGTTVKSICTETTFDVNNGARVTIQCGRFETF